MKRTCKECNKTFKSIQGLKVHNGLNHKGTVTEKKVFRTYLDGFTDGMKFARETLNESK